MAKLVWDQTGDHLYETGVKNCALFVIKEDGTYDNGVAWSGITAINESPSGAEATALYADDIKYLNLYSAEELGLTIEAYTFPEEFEVCDGCAEIADGVVVGQQQRSAFGLAYITTVGNDVKGNDFGQKLHLVYNCKTSPTEKSFNTINDSPEANTFSWECNCTPVSCTVNSKASTTYIVTVDSTKCTAAKFKALCDTVFGTDATTGDNATAGTNPTLPLPDAVATMMATA